MGHSPSALFGLDTSKSRVSVKLDEKEKLN